MFLPKLLSIVLLVISLAMLVPVGLAVHRIAGGAHIPTMQWALPLAIMASASVMMWLLTRKAVSLQLYLMAFSLWLITAGYFFYITEF